MYYHLIENFGSKFAHVGVFKTEQEAEAERERRQKLYPDLDFFVEAWPTKREPPYINV